MKKYLLFGSILVALVSISSFFVYKQVQATEDWGLKTGFVVDVTPSGTALGTKYYDFYPGMPHCPEKQWAPDEPDPNGPPTQIAYADHLTNIKLRDGSNNIIASTLYTFTQTEGSFENNEIHATLVLDNSLVINGATYKLEAWRVVFHNCFGVVPYVGGFIHRPSFTISIPPITVPPVVINSFSAVPNPVHRSKTVTFSWSSTNATNCKIDPGITSALESLNPSGSISMTMRNSDSYDPIQFKLTCFNERSEASQTVSVSTFDHLVHWRGNMKTSCSASESTLMSNSLEQDVRLTEKVIKPNNVITNYPNERLNDGNDRVWGNVVPTTYQVVDESVTFNTPNNNSLYTYCGDSGDVVLDNNASQLEKTINLYFAPINPGTSSFSQSSTSCGGEYSFSVSGGPKNTSGDLYKSLDGGNTYVKTSNWLTTDDLGNVTKGPWSCASAYTETVYIQWPNGTKTNTVTHTCSAPCPVPLTASISAEHPSVLYNNNVKITWSSNGDSCVATKPASGFNTNNQPSGNQWVTVPAQGDSVTYEIRCTKGSENVIASTNVSLFKQILHVDAHLRPNGCSAPETSPVGDLASAITITYEQKTGTPIVSQHSVHPNNTIDPWGKVVLSITPQTATITEPGYTLCGVSNAVSYSDPYTQEEKTIYAEFAPPPGSDVPSCSVLFNPGSVSDQGEETNLEWNSENDADGILPYQCTGSLGSGNLNGASGSLLVNPLKTQNCTLTVKNSSGQTNNCSAQVVTPPDAPSNVTASASCFSPTKAQALISWDAVSDASEYIVKRVGFLWNKTVGTTNQTSIIDNNDGSGLNLNDEYEYYVIAVNSAGESDRSIIASINTPVTCSSGVTVDINANPENIDSGETSDLTWTSSGATSCSINQNIGSVPLNGAGETAETVQPPSTTTYTITCLNDLGESAQDSATVTVSGFPPPGFSCVLTANPSAGGSPLNVDLSASGAGGTSPYEYRFDYTGDGIYDTNYGNGSANHQYSSSATAKAEIKDAGGATNTCTAGITVDGVPPPPPSSGSFDLKGKSGFAQYSDGPITIEVPPANPIGSLDLQWTSSGVSSCSGTPVVSSWGGDLTLPAGVKNLSLGVGQYTFKGNCQLITSGGTISDSVVVNVVTQQVGDSCSINANPSSVLYKATSTLEWSCNNPEDGAECSISADQEGQDIGSVEPPVGGSVSTKVLTKTVTYTLSCTGFDDVTAKVNVGFIPVIREIIPR